MSLPRCFLTIVLSLCVSALTGCAHLNPPPDSHSKNADPLPLFELPKNATITTTPTPATPYQQLPQPPAPQQVPQQAPAPPPTTDAPHGAAAATGTSPSPEPVVIHQTVHQEQHHYQGPAD